MYQKLVNRLRSKKRGFTLIELIIVIAILAILAAILIPSMLNIIQDSRDKVGVSNARSIYSAAQQAYIQLGITGSEPEADSYESTEEEEIIKLINDNLGDGFLSGGSSYTVVVGDNGIISVTFNDGNDNYIFDPADVGTEDEGGGN